MKQHVLHLPLAPLFSLRLSLFFPNVEAHVFRCREMTLITKSTLAKGNQPNYFKKIDDYCRSDELYYVVLLT